MLLSLLTARLLAAWNFSRSFVVMQEVQDANIPSHESQKLNSDPGAFAQSLNVSILKRGYEQYASNGLVFSEWYCRWKDGKIK